MPPKKTTKKADADYTYESNSDYSDGGSDDDVEEEQTFRGKRGRKGQFKKGSKGGPQRSGISKAAPEAEILNEFQDYSRTLTLKSDHRNRPIWITPESIIYLEAFSPHYQGAYDFLVAIGEPVSRPKFIHTYRLTEDSLYAAVALSIDTNKILKKLSQLCKTNLPEKVKTYIKDCKCVRSFFRSLVWYMLLYALCFMLYVLYHMLFPYTCRNH